MTRTLDTSHPMTSCIRFLVAFLLGNSLKLLYVSLSEYTKHSCFGVSCSLPCPDNYPERPGPFVPELVKRQLHRAALNR